VMPAVGGQPAALQVRVAAPAVSSV
jgi:hypothetical protein